MKVEANPHRKIQRSGGESTKAWWEQGGSWETEEKGESSKAW